MKVLFLADNDRDMSAAYLWRGLREYLGDDNVVDGVNCHSLRGRSWAGTEDADQIKMTGPVPTTGHRILQSGEDDFDIVLGVTSFLRKRSWDAFRNFSYLRKRGGKLVWFDTYDSVKDIWNPPIPVDAVFRREIDPAVQYPYEHKPLPLQCAAPEAWFEKFSHEKPRDVFCVQNALTTGRAWPARWKVCSKVFQTQRWHDSLVGSQACFSLVDYLKQMPQYKLCVCSPGGGDSADSTRTWEAIAVGTIPILAGHDCRVRMYWFCESGDPATEELFRCAVDELPATIDRALEMDLRAMRQRMKEHALKYHTTKARAEQFVRLVMSDAWKSPPPELNW